MKTITKLFCLGLLGAVLTTATSCGDDDDSSIVYNQHSYTKVYSADEAKSFVSSVADELFSSTAIDTSDFQPLISDCRYFNNTYLKYKTSSDEAPFDSVVSNLTKLMSGDLSGLNATLNRYKRYAGAYTANTTTGKWEWNEAASKKNSIALTFKDQAGVDMTAKLTWLTVSSASAAATSDDTESLSDSANVIKVVDRTGNVIRDTLPNKVKFTITGGQNNINFSSSVELKVSGANYVAYDALVTMNGYVISVSQQTSNDYKEKTARIVRNHKTLITINTKTKGNNLVRYLADPVSYPVTSATSQVTVNMLDKMEVTSDVNKLQYMKKMTELSESGKTSGTEEYAKALVGIVNDTHTTIASDIVNNAYIGSYTLVPYYSETNTKWGVSASIMLNDKSEYSMIGFTDNTIMSYLMAQAEELTSRLSSLLGTSN